MANKIGGYGPGTVDITSSRARNVSRGDRAGGSASVPARDAGADAVRLTDTATNLKQIEARLASLPDVDQARVDAVRQRLESGNYQVNPERVASRLLRMEQELA